jgi:MFS family permease
VANPLEISEREPLLGTSAAVRIRPAKVPAVSLLEAMREPLYRRAVFAVIAVMIAQQATGINSVMMYSVEVLGVALPSAAALITVTVSAVNVVVTIMCAPLADKIGRKPCLLLSISGMGTGSLLLAIGLIYNVPALSVFATFLFVASFGVGLGPIPFILASELVDSEAVGAIQSWGLTACWFATFCVAQFFPMLNAALPNGYVFWGFLAMAIFLGSFIAWWIPESKGKATAAEVWGDD